MTRNVDLRIGDTWLSSIGPTTDLELSTNRRGSYEATWTMSFADPLRRHPALVRGKLVDAYLGPVPIWTGTFTEPNWADGSFAAIGTYREAEGTVATNAAGRPTTKPNTAIDEAIARGQLTWERIAEFTDTAKAGGDGGSGSGGADDPEPVQLIDLMDAAKTAESKQWRVDRWRRLVEYGIDEAAPDWLIVPDSGVLGVADDHRVDRVILTYKDSAEGDKRRSVSWPATALPGGIEFRADISRWGPMSAANATLYATGIYVRLGSGRDGWTNGLNLVAGQILTPGGRVAHLSNVRGGQVAWMLGVPDRRSTALYTPFVIDETKWRVAENTIDLNPVGMVARSPEAVLRHVLPDPPDGGAIRLHLER